MPHFCTLAAAACSCVLTRAHPVQPGLRPCRCAPEQPRCPLLPLAVTCRRWRCPWPPSTASWRMRWRCTASCCRTACSPSRPPSMHASATRGPAAAGLILFALHSPRCHPLRLPTPSAFLTSRGAWPMPALRLYRSNCGVHARGRPRHWLPLLRHHAGHGGQGEGNGGLFLHAAPGCCCPCLAALLPIVCAEGSSRARFSITRQSCGHGSLCLALTPERPRPEPSRLRPPAGWAWLQADVVTVSTLIACCERLGDWHRAQEVWRWMESQVGGAGPRRAGNLRQPEPPLGRHWPGPATAAGPAARHARRPCCAQPVRRGAPLRSAHPCCPSRCRVQGLEPDTICYNTMISCMERSNQPDRALAVFEDMMASARVGGWSRRSPKGMGPGGLHGWGAARPVTCTG